MPTRKPPPEAPAPPPPRKRGQPPYAPTEKDRLTVKVMVAGGIEQLAIASVLGISGPTLRKHFRREIATASAEANAAVVASLHALAVGRPARKATDNAAAQSAIPANVHAAKWWTQARMDWTEGIRVTSQQLDKHGKPANAEVVYRWAEPEPSEPEKQP